jgi:hypothetical protein
MMLEARKWSGPTKETQGSIAQWVESTYGPAPHHLCIAARANEEMAELVHAFHTRDDPAKISAKAAEVAIVLCRLAECLGITILPFRYQKASKTPAIAANLALAKAINELTRYREIKAAILVADAVRHLATLVDKFGDRLEVAIDRKMVLNRAQFPAPPESRDPWPRLGDPYSPHVLDDESTMSLLEQHYGNKAVPKE